MSIIWSDGSKVDSGNFDIGTDFEFYDKVDGEFSLTNPSMGLTLKALLEFLHN